jgi:hypothetical protein
MTQRRQPPGPSIFDRQISACLIAGFGQASLKRLQRERLLSPPKETNNRPLGPLRAPQSAKPPRHQEGQ